MRSNFLIVHLNRILFVLRFTAAALDNNGSLISTLDTFILPQIINLGRSLKTLDGAWLEIMWPKAIYNGKWLLYLMKIDSKGIDSESCQPSSEINERKLKVICC